MPTRVRLERPSASGGAAARATRASLALIRRLGFRREGFARRCLQVLGRWSDHERWALLADE